MTRAHRQGHRRIWLAFVVLVPLILVVGLLVRRPVPVMSGVADPLAPSPSNFTPR